MARHKVHQSEEDHQEAAKKYQKRYYEKNKATILQKMQLKYSIMKSRCSSTSNMALRCNCTNLSLDCVEDGELSSPDPDMRFCKLINSSTHRFLDNLTLQYISRDLLEESQKLIHDALNISQEAEDAIRESGGDGTECWQVILSLEDILLHVFEDEDIQCAHNQS
ncbi:hypothetical protein BDR04DRAFT_1119934 [Suillus decipiens]|nr:hypothetical protein BDR04DRAFT_1119934 [Suillus decipiens]